VSSNEAASTEPLRLNGAKIAALLSAATPGPWVYSPERHTHDSPIHTANAVESHGYIGADNGCVVGSSEWIWLTEGDGDLIAATPDIAARVIEAEAVIRDFLDATDSVMRQNFSGFDIDEIEDRARAFLGEL
jgi:hypothetical protein